MSLGDTEDSGTPGDSGELQRELDDARAELLEVRHAKQQQEVRLRLVLKLLRTHSFWQAPYIQKEIHHTTGDL